MKILESGDWVLRVPKIPNIETWIPVVVVGDYKLGGYERVPHHLRLFWLDCFVLRIIRLRVEVVVVGCLIGCLGRLCELENRFALLQIPNDDLPILRSAS